MEEYNSYMGFFDICLEGIKVEKRYMSPSVFGSIIPSWQESIRGYVEQALLSEAEAEELEEALNKPPEAIE